MTVKEQEILQIQKELREKMLILENLIMGLHGFNETNLYNLFIQNISRIIQEGFYCNLDELLDLKGSKQARSMLIFILINKYNYEKVYLANYFNKSRQSISSYYKYGVFLFEENINFRNKYFLIIEKCELKKA